MNKIDLIQALKDSNNLTRSEAEKIVTHFFDKIAEALSQGERVEIRGLCSFFVKKYNAYTGRNPKTGEKVKVARKKLPFFKVGKELKERVDRWRQKTVSANLMGRGLSEYITKSADTLPPNFSKTEEH